MAMGTSNLSIFSEHSSQGFDGDVPVKAMQRSILGGHLFVFELVHPLDQVQALVSPFLLDDTVEDMDESFIGDQPGDGQPQADLVAEVDSSSYNYDHLKGIDPVAANRIHPNNHRKISQYLCLYAHHGVLPSQLLQERLLKLVVTRSSEEHMSGNNTSRVVAIANESRLKNLKDFSQWSSSSRLNIEAVVSDLQFFIIVQPSFLTVQGLLRKKGGVYFSWDVMFL
ncbi:hypothetical protein GBA52_027178 [Prunus armeniaca]|nr:hypothetical protein GBA52_027178 [Prunus armeniaca]